MKNKRTAIITLSLGLLTASCTLVAGEASNKPDADQIAKWVQQLGDEEYRKRVDAEQQLLKAGELARAELEKAAKGDSAEARSRATRLLGVLKTEPVLRKMEAATLKAGSIEADMVITMNLLGNATDMTVHFKSTADGKRFVMDGKVGVMGQKVPVHVVSDGVTMWSETTVPMAGNKKMVQKYSMKTIEKLGGGGSQNPLQSVRDMRKRFVFTDVKEEKASGVDCYVLEGKLREGALEKQVKAAEEVGGAMAAQGARA